MNRFVRWGFALVILPVAACADNTPPPAPMAPPAPPPLASADASFLSLAAQGDMAEVNEAQMALKMSHNPRVKMYANKMIADHTAANNQLTQIAQGKGVTLPTAVSDAQMQEATKLQGMMGHHFDRAYIDDQIAGHQQMVVAYQAEAQNGMDPDVKKFAADTLPVVQQHLDMAGKMTPPMYKHMMRHHHMAKKSS